MRGLVEDAKKTKLSHNNNNNVASSRIKSTSSSSAMASSSSGSRPLRGVSKTAATTSNVATVKKAPQSIPPQVGKSTKIASTTAVGAGAAAPTTSKTTTKSHKVQNSTPQQQVEKTPQQPTPQQQPPQASNNSNTIALPKASHANHTNEELAGGVQDTIYLCNFRVSVDGEWLCLKELQDIDVPGGPHTVGGGAAETVSATGGGAGSRLSRNQNKRFPSLSTAHVSSALEDNARDTAEIERSNLVNICKLVVKELLEQSLRYGRMLDSDHLPLQHFFIVIEHVLGHGLRPKKGLLGPRKELWDLLQSVENYCPEAQDITASVRDLPTVRTHIGRARAWLRIALMQKKLSDYLQALIEHRDDSLYDYYEPQALMMSDEIVVIMGILVGLNVIDCNLCVKEEDLDSQQGVIDFSLYLRSSSHSAELTDDGTTSGHTNPPALLYAAGQGNMIAVLDQKNYIEELNRHLNATVGNLQAKVESLTTTNALMKEDLAIARNSLLALQAENQAMRQSSQNNQNSDNSSHGSDKQSETLSSELAEERKRAVELEKELKLQVSLKAESDMAMKLLEKDIHEKQDTIVSLRRQLDDIKQINLEMYRKLQECEDELTQKGEMVSRLQTKASQIGNILQSLEKKYESKLVDQQHHPSADRSPNTRRQQNLEKFEALTKKHKQDAGPPMKRLHLKMEGIPPFNPNNYRKSPGSAVAGPGPVPAQEAQVMESKEIKTPTSAKSLNDELAEAAAAVTQHFKGGGIIDGSRSDYALSREQAGDA